MFKVQKASANRVDIELSGRLDTKSVKVAVNELVEKTEGIENGRMPYDVLDFNLPSPHARYRRLIERLGERFVLFSHTADAANELLYVSAAFETVFGIPAERVLKKHWADVIRWSPGEADRALASQVDLARNGEEFTQLEMRFIHPDGQERTIRISEYLSEDEEGRQVIEGICEDITAQRRNETELKRLATCDDLTGLFSRNVLDARLSDEIERAERYQHCVSLLLLDLDRFKQINDVYGHPAGDKVLVRVADVIRMHTRAADFGVRIGGDEFVVVLPETNREEAIRLAVRLRESVAEVGHALRFCAARLSASIGVSTYPLEGKSPEELIRKADIAMYRVKSGTSVC